MLKPSSSSRQRIAMEDESSLGGDSSAQRLRKTGLIPSGSSSSSASASRSAASVTGAASTVKPLVIHASDLASIRSLAQGTSSTDARLEAAAATEKAASARLDASQARAERIRSFEGTRVSRVPKTELELEEEAEVQRRRDLARRKAEADLDEVKAMNAMKNYAIVAAVRDRQRADRVESKAAEALAEKMRDLQMEVARLEEVKRVHTVEEASRVGARLAARDVYRQLAEREEAKRAATLARQREADETVAQVAAMQAEGKRRMALERKAQQAKLDAVLASNQEALRLKAERKAADIAEDKRIEAVQLAMALEKEERSKPRRAVTEQVLQAVSGSVQKQMDAKIALDELQARRAYEAGQRAERERELLRARAAAEALDNLRRERTLQMAVKQERVAEEVRYDKAEFEIAAAVQEEWLAGERKTSLERRLANRDHAAALLAQKEEKERERAAARAATLNDGDGDRAAEVKRQALVGRLRDENLAELSAMGINPVYATSLARQDPSYALRMDYRLGAKGLPGGDKKSNSSSSGGGGGGPPSSPAKKK